MRHLSPSLFVLFFTSISVSGGIAPLSGTYQENKKFAEPEVEGNKRIMEAKKNTPNLGGYLFLALRNTGAKSVSLKDFLIDGVATNTLLKKYSLVWSRMSPTILEPGACGTLEICLRNALTENVSVKLLFSDGSECAFNISGRKQAPCQFEAVRFEKGLRRVWIHVGKALENAAIPAAIRFDGVVAGSGQDAPEVKWLNDEWEHGAKLASLTLKKTLNPGSFHLLELLDASGKSVAVCEIRALDELFGVGIYGGTPNNSRGFTRYAANGLNLYNSFHKLSAATLDKAASMDMRCVSMVHDDPKAEPGHSSGLYAFNLMDEPDCRDYRVKDVPMRYRIGQHAPKMVEWYEKCLKFSPRPVMLTLDLTFSPFNYFFYGRIPDIANPDCYPITQGWPVGTLKKYVGNIRQATRPKPFSFTYQGSWEEHCRKVKWISGSQLKRDGWSAYRDVSKTRGFGRPPTKAETALNIHYAFAYGATSVFAYTDVSEACGTLMFHGARDMPEIWRAIVSTSKIYSRLAPVIEISNSVRWAETSEKSILTRTLMTGADTAVVIAVNENHKSVKEGFETTKAENVEFSFDIPSWSSAQSVFEVTPDGFLPVASEIQGKTLTWHDDIVVAKVYLVATKKRAEQLDELQADREARVEKAIERIRAESEANQRFLKHLAVSKDVLKLTGKPFAGNGLEDHSFWNPQKEKFNAIDCWRREGVETLGTTWSVDVDKKMLGEEWLFITQIQGRPAKWKIEASPKDAAVISPDSSFGKTRKYRVKFKQPGKVELKLRLTPGKSMEHYIRTSKIAYLTRRGLEK